MIFVAVGTQLPFDRMVHAVDRWADASGFPDVFAQVGPTKQPPRFIPWTQSLTPQEYEAHVDAADVVVSHAGMGTILTCLLKRKPVLVMARHARLGEQRNDHQLATAARLSAMGLLDVARDEHHLAECLDRLTTLAPRAEIGEHAASGLIDSLRSFIQGTPVLQQMTEPKIPMLVARMEPVPVEPGLGSGTSARQPEHAGSR